jgi:hypothetical protein
MSELDARLRDLPPADPPPLSPELEAMLADLRPVRTRRPWLDLLKVAGISLAYASAFLAIVRMRREIDDVPVWWMVTVGLAWLIGFGSMTYLAIVPRRGSVMPRWRLVGIGAVVVGLGFVGAGLMMHPMSDQSTELGLARIHHGHACLEIGLATAVVPVILGALVLRGAMPVGDRWTAAGLGAAGGSLGGLVLHLHCPIADGWHLGLVHGGVVVISALLSAALVPRVTH